MQILPNQFPGAARLLLFQSLPGRAHISHVKIPAQIRGDLLRQMAVLCLTGLSQAGVLLIGLGEFASLLSLKSLLDFGLSCSLCSSPLPSARDDSKHERQHNPCRSREGESVAPNNLLEPIERTGRSRDDGV